MLRKLIAGGPGRKTRLHDHHGARISLGRALRNGPRAVGSGLQRILLKSYPSKPWISYDGQAIIADHLTKNSRVLEFGSGTSTSWYADRCGFLLSHEHNEEWFQLVGNIVGDRVNVVRELCLSKDDYVNVSDAHRGEPFDLIMIDGRYRDECLNECLGLLSEDGIVYLDNSDKHSGEDTGDIPAARKTIMEYARQHGKCVETITDFAPSQFFVSECTIMYNGKHST